MSNPALQSAQRFLDRHGLIPRSRLARFCLVLALIVDAWAMVGVHGYSAAYRITEIVLCGALLVLGYRAFSRRFMWRLRNRLIVTYVFIGVVPLGLLATMGIVAGYLFAGQFSTFVVTTDVRNELLRLESSNRTVTHQAAAELRRSGTIDARELAISNEAFPGRRMTAYYQGRSVTLIGGAIGEPVGGAVDKAVGEHGTGEPAMPPPQVAEAVLIDDEGELYLRAVNRRHVGDGTSSGSGGGSGGGSGSGAARTGGAGTREGASGAGDAGGDELVVVSSVPLDKAHLESIVANMGIITLYGEQSAGVSSGSTSAAVSSARSGTQSGAQSGTQSDSSGAHGSGMQSSEPHGAGTRITGTQSSGTHIKVGDTEVDAKPKVICGSMPPPVFGMDLDFAPFVTILNAVHWKTGEPATLLLTVRTRPSLLYNRLFRTLGDSTNMILIALVAIAVIFALIEVVALIIGVRLTRTMTSSVTKLYDATQLVNQGEFTHRIQVDSYDQLASLENSFNSMTESLEKLIAEQKEKQRIESELTIAKEVQDLLFPHDAADLDGLELHGICRPARTVSGDYYDFLPVGPNAVGLAMGDISGKGISAALMMATVHAFVRAHTLVEPLTALAAVQAQSGVANRANNRANTGEATSGATSETASETISETISETQTMEATSLQLDQANVCPRPGTVLAQLNQQLYISTPAQKYATMFLGFYDQTSRRLTYSNAGHLPPIVIRNANDGCTNGGTQLLDTGGTVVGLFGGMVYPEGSVTLNPGDIVVAFSDGITEPENDYGEFGEERLTQIVEENRDLPLARISDAILAAVLDWIGGEEQPDDMTVVLARAR